MALTKVTGQVVNSTTDLTVGVLTATTVSVGGTLTYEDVTNVDSVGLITARSGINVTSGRVLVNTTTVLESSSAAKLHIAHTSGASIALGRDDSSVAADNDMGKIAFYGNDGGSYEKVAQITCEADKSHASGDKPGRLVFSTTADNASVPTERMRIDSSGNVGINRTSPNGLFHMQSPSGTASAFYIQTSATSDACEINFGDNTASAKGSLHYVNSDDSMRFNANSSEQMRITQSGTIGMGDQEPMTDARLTLAGVNNVSLGFKRSGSGKFDSAIHCDGGAMIFKGGADSNSVSGLNEHMRIDSSGRLLVGATSPPFDQDYAVLQLVHSTSPALILARDDTTVNINEDLGSISFFSKDAGTYQRGAKISAEADDGHTANSRPTSLRFFTCPDNSTSASERMRVKHSGILEVKSDSTRQASFGILNSNHHNGENFIQIYGGSTDNFLLLRACNANDGTPILDSNVLGTRRIEIEADGDIYNQNDVYGQLSDAKLKENIVDVSSQWDDIKALRVRNFNFREDLGYQPNTQIGFVAQEVEQVSPGLVKSVTDSDSDGNDLGTKTKVVKTSVLHVKAVKALQEAMARIEVLEARIAALEGS